MDTLTKRLAGPSTNKAGMEGVDQSKVNEIIFKASEVLAQKYSIDSRQGSKFFENERRKDVELTKKIQDMLKRKTKIEGMDLSYEQSKADDKVSHYSLIQKLRQILHWERTRDLTQYIVHIGRETFYLVSTQTVMLFTLLLRNWIDQNWSTLLKKFGQNWFRHLPMGVGQGVLTTANYEARKYGVRSAMPSYIAKKLCPQIILLPLNFPKYVAKGHLIPILSWQ